jgi:hypothetical protein
LSWRLLPSSPPHPGIHSFSPLSKRMILQWLSCFDCKILEKVCRNKVKSSSIPAPMKDSKWREWCFPTIAATALAACLHSSSSVEGKVTTIHIKTNLFICVTIMSSNWKEITFIAIKIFFCPLDLCQWHVLAISITESPFLCPHLSSQKHNLLNHFLDPLLLILPHAKGENVWQKGTTKIKHKAHSAWLGQHCPSSAI